MIVRSQATVLQIRPWSQTSHMVTWLTPEFGKVVTPVKGACRPKSAFLGQYDLFYTCDLLFYRREHDGVHAIRECFPLNLREPLRGRWRHVAAAVYLADLTARVTPGQQEARAVFELLNAALDLLTALPEPPWRALLLWYEAHLLRHLGLLPDLATCPHCHTPATLWLRFSLPSGHFVCDHRTRAQTGEATVSLHRGVRKLFQGLLQAESPEQAERLLSSLASNKSSGAQNLLLGLSRFLGIFITFHLDAPSAVRRIAWEMVDKTPSQNTALQETRII